MDHKKTRLEGGRFHHIVTATNAHNHDLVLTGPDIETERARATADVDGNVTVEYIADSADLAARLVPTRRTT